MNYVIKLLKPMLRPDSNIVSIEVKGSACDKYNAFIQKRVGRTVWASCTSYYNQYGGKNVCAYPLLSASPCNTSRFVLGLNCTFVAQYPGSAT